ncbi:hypothetical protein WJX84_006826 [Apatococcus fuscideae]|uniref:THO complex subunit 2 n=1 Tax=Apatococcus fuscideae TaxID=2026836 RepID=A0AAW1SWW7_9CHLO
MEVKSATEDQSSPLAEDCLWYSFIEANAKPDADASQVVAAAKDLLAKQKVSSQHLQETAENEFLEELGLIADAKRFKTKAVQTNTKLLYAQQKYNLLREEPEGFGKAINALSQFGKGGLTPEGVSYLLRELRALIGYFDLDPIRLADLVLDAFASQPENVAFLELMQLFPSEALPHILGFKFSVSAKEQSTASRSYATALSLIAAQLIKAKRIELDALLPHLQPSDEALRKSIPAALLKLEAIAKEVNSTAFGGGKPEGAQDAKISSLAVAASRLELAALPLEDAAFAPLAEGNHKLALTAGLIKLEPFHTWLLQHGLCSSASQVDDSAPELTQEAVDILHALDFRVASDPVLFTKVVRVLGLSLGRHLGPMAPPESTPQIAELQQMLQQILLPGLQLVPANAAVTHEVWRLLRMLPYRTRFNMYARWQEMQGQHILLYAAGSLALREVRRVLRRITNEDSDEERRERKRLVGIAAKAVHANPLAALDPGVTQATAYTAMQEAIVETLRYVTPMGHDVLTYIIVDNLASPHRLKLARDGLNVSQWLQNLAVFVGLVCRKCPDVDLHAILEYLACRLKEFEVSELVVIKEIFTSLSGIDMIHSLNPHQLEATAGGDTLRAHSVAMAGNKVIGQSEQHRNAKRLLAALQKGPPEQHLLLPILVLLAQQRQHIATRSDVKELKLMLELFDQCSETLSQYIKFLQTYLSKRQYKELIPSMDTLVRGYGLDVEVAWQTHRHLTNHLEPDTSTPPEDGEVEDQEGAAPKEAGNEIASSNLSPHIDASTQIDDAGRDPKTLNELERRMWQQWQAHPASGADAAAMDIDGESEGTSWRSLVQASRNYLPASTKTLLRPDFYLAFWNLQYYDIHVPEERYKEAMDTLRQQIAEQARLVRESSKMRSTSAKKEHPALVREHKRLQETLDKLTAELNRQKRHVEEVYARMSLLKEDWNDDTTSRMTGSNVVFIQDCILPRCLYSPEDAAFAGTYLSLLTKLATAWPIALVYNKVFTQLLSVLACTSEREAQNLAITLEILLSDVTRWQEDPDAFAKECMISKGWCVDASSPEPKEPIAYPMFSQLYIRWLRLLAQMMVHLLKSEVYIQMRNALLVLQAIRKVFPRSKLEAEMLLDAFKAVLDKETREDLKLNLTSYMSWLDSESKKPNNDRWMQEGDGSKADPSPEVSGARPLPEPSADSISDAKKSKVAAATVPAPSSTAQMPVQLESESEKPQSGSRKPPTAPAAEAGKEKPREKEPRPSKREPAQAQRTASIPVPSKKRPAHEPREDQQPPTKEAKNASNEARGSHANGHLPESKSPQSGEKRKPVLSPDAEAFVPQAVKREGSNKPEEPSQPVASSHRHHKRPRTEEDPKKDRKKDRERERDRHDKDRGDKDKGREKPSSISVKQEPPPPSPAAAAPTAPAGGTQARHSDGHSPKQHAAGMQDVDVKREHRREREKKAEKERKAEKEKDRGRDAMKPSSRQGEDTRREPRLDKPQRAADRDEQPPSETKRSAERSARRDAAVETAPVPRKSSGRRSEPGEPLGDGQTARPRRPANGGEAVPAPRSEIPAPATRDIDRRDRERQAEDARHERVSGRASRERSVPRDTARRGHSRIPGALPVSEGPRPLGTKTECDIVSSDALAQAGRPRGFSTVTTQKFLGLRTSEYLVFPRSAEVTWNKCRRAHEKAGLLPCRRNLNGTLKSALRLQETFSRPINDRCRPAKIAAKSWSSARSAADRGPAPSVALVRQPHPRTTCKERLPGKGAEQEQRWNQKSEKRAIQVDLQQNVPMTASG